MTVQKPLTVQRKRNPVDGMLVTVLYRYAQISEKSVSADMKNFGDAKSVSRYAVDAMKWAVGTGIIKGMYGELVPQGAATRAQAATVIMRLKLE